MKSSPGSRPSGAAPFAACYKRMRCKRSLLLAVFLPTLCLCGVALWYTNSRSFHRVLSQHLHPVPYTIEVDTRLLRGEGLGSMLSTLKPVLMLANWTGATITGRPLHSPHGYDLTQYFRLAKPIPGSQRRRRVCSGVDVTTVLRNIAAQCTAYDHASLRFMFWRQWCNTLVVKSIPVHARNCLAATAPLMRAFTTFPAYGADRTPKTDLCVLRRGGDVEEKIRSGIGNMWAIDEELAVPLLQAARNRSGAKLVIATQTKYADELRQKFHEPDVLSNGDRLHDTVAKLSRCRCLFVSAGSSFASALVPILQPTTVVYSQNRTGFEFDVAPYHYEEYGEGATSILAAADTIVDKCVPGE